MVVVISSEGQEKMVSTGGDPRSATANSGWCGWTASAVTPPPVLRNLRGDNTVSITEKAPTRAFSWMKVATTTFTFKTLLRHNVNGC